MDITPQQNPEIQPKITPKAQRRPRPDLFQRVEFTEDNVGFHGGSRRRAGVKLALWSWLSAAVDTLILISISCFFMMAFSLLMKVSAVQVMQTVVKDFSLLKLFAGCFLMSFWIYLVFMRVFNGATLGEWACHLRLGQPMQRLRSDYILKVILRTTLVMFTGIVILPLLSLFMKRDLPGDLAGLKIYSLI